jgi:hypothetical protein
MATYSVIGSGNHRQAMLQADRRQVNRCHPKLKPPEPMRPPDGRGSVVVAFQSAGEVARARAREEAAKS